MSVNQLSEVERETMKKKIEALLPYIGVTGVLELLVDISYEYYQKGKERGAVQDTSEWAMIGSELESVKSRIYAMVRDGIRSSAP